MKTIIIEPAREIATPLQAGLYGSGGNGPVGVFGMWGKVTESHSEDNTVDVITDRGLAVSRLPVASFSWVGTAGGETSGRRDLPPKDSYVFIFMPEGIIETSFVLCSGFPRRQDRNVKQDFLVSGKEDEIFEMLPGGYVEKYDKASGDLQIDTKHGQTIKLSSEGINVSDSAGNEIQIKPAGVTIKSVMGKITGGVFEMAGVAAPGAAPGEGPFCALPMCFLTGMIHTGKIVAGT